MKKNQSSQVASLISPVHGCRDALRRKGIKPKNHHQLNLSYIKSLKNLKTPSPKPAIRPVSIPPNTKNYIFTNINTIKALQIPELEDSAESIINKDLLGKVPAYLSTIKQTLKQQKEKQ